jgi:uncharacterized protein (DUF1697 family)
MAKKRYAILLRGVNVGAKNSLPMGELRSMLTAVGCADVQTYVQSGNAVFSANRRMADVTRAVEEALERYMGRPIATVVRTETEMNAIVAANPLAKVVTHPAYSCVTFLSHTPSKAELAPLYTQDFGPEIFSVEGKEIYTWHPHGQARSALATALGKLKVRGAVTTRNWNTVQKLVAMLGDRAAR